MGDGPLGMQVWWVRNGEAEKRHKDGQIGTGSERSTLHPRPGKRMGVEKAARDGNRGCCGGGEWQMRVRGGREPGEDEPGSGKGVWILPECLCP